ncbi:MAG: 5-(carboxyamino)imidazole ribonucleotide synthase [Bacteroidia bacterium]|nr:5-(carboxyamino)imidazole ribonucleotide synthase [Bacteroidia bacterium]
METKFYNGLRIGFLGGGQLGRMAIQEAISLNTWIGVLDPDPDAPCKYIAHEFHQGSLQDYQTVLEFGRKFNLVTIEIEHVNTQALFDLEKEGIQVFPQPSILEMVKDKGLQKQFYLENGIPTSRFKLIDADKSIHQYNWSYPFIQKLRKGGYDGKGVTKIESAKDLGFSEASLIEECIDFKKEIAVIVARNLQGEIKTFPMVEMEFDPKANLVEFLYWPSDETQEIQNKAAEIAINLAAKTGIVGLLAVEMFLTRDGQILVNEIAPRTHNSGHHTIEAARTSQFMQHLRALLNLPLGSTDLVYPAAMINLLGEEGHTGLVEYQGLEQALAMPGVYVHLYGKNTTKPFRKMGHITITGTNLSDVKEKAKLVKSMVKVRSVNKT